MYWIPNSSYCMYIFFFLAQIMDITFCIILYVHNMSKYMRTQILYIVLDIYYVGITKVYMFDDNKQYKI